MNDALVFRVSIDDSGLPAAAVSTAAAAQRVAESFNVGQRSAQQMQRQTALTRQELLTLNYTLSDVAASLASGASPFTILLQQGGQVVQGFGGFSNLFSRIGSAITVARVAAGALVGVLAGLAVAWFEGRQQSEAVTRALNLSGDAAGLTRDRFESMAVAVSKASGATATASREILLGLVQAGTVGPGAIQQIATAAAAMAKATGQSSEEVVKDFVAMAGGVSRWAAEHNKSYNYITAEQFKHIRALEAQGKVTEAQIENARLLKEAAERVNTNLGTLEKAWNAIKEASSAAWNAMLGIGKEAPLNDQLDKARAAVANAERYAKVARLPETQAYYNNNVENARESLRLLQRSIADQQTIAQQAGEKAIKEQRKIAAIQAGSQAMAQSIELAGFAKSQALQQTEREQTRIAEERAFQARELGANAFERRSYVRARQAVQDKIDLIDKEIEIEKKRPMNGDNADVDAQRRQEKLIQLQTKRIEVARELLLVDEKRQQGGFRGVPSDDLETENQRFRRFEASQRQSIETALQDRRTEALRSSSELLQVSRDLGIALLQDDRQRGEATIAIEEAEWRKRLDLASLSASERRQVEEDLATWRTLREKQLTEELKPEYQRQLDLFADQMRYMKKASEEFHQGFIDQGRDAFTTWLTTGKLSAANLVSFIQQQLARIVYDRYLSSAVDSVGGALFGALFGGGFQAFDAAGIGITSGGNSLVDLGLGGGRAAGGPVRRGMAYPVNETGQPELLTARGRQWVLPTADGTVTPAGGWGGGQGDLNVTIAPVFHGGVSRAELQAGMVYAVDVAVARVAEARRRGNPGYIN